MSAYEFLPEYEKVSARPGHAGSYEGFRDRFKSLLPDDFYHRGPDYRRRARALALELRLSMTRAQEIDFFRGAWSPKVSLADTR